MEIIVYHCSPDKILNFDFTSGVHFGGISSAYEAVYRKLDNIDESQEYAYVHSCKLKLKNIIDVEDVGNYEEWLIQKQRAEEDGKAILRYKNKYEPDSKPSYFVLDSSLISIVSIETISKKDLESYLVELVYG